MQPQTDGPATPRPPITSRAARLAMSGREALRHVAAQLMDGTPGTTAPTWLQRRLPVSVAALTAWIALDLALIAGLSSALVALSQSAQLAANQRPARVLAIATAASPNTIELAASPQPPARILGSGRAVAPGLEPQASGGAQAVLVADASDEFTAEPGELPVTATPLDPPTSLPAQGVATSVPAALNLIAVAQPVATGTATSPPLPLPTSTDLPIATEMPPAATETVAPTITATDTAFPTETASPTPTETPTRTPPPLVVSTWTPTLPGAPGWYGYGACALHEQTGPVGGNPLIWPADSHTVSGYVYSGWHPGIDVSAVYGDPIYAIDSGVVVYSGWNDTGYGTFLIIDHGDGLWSAYAHLSQTLVGCLDPVAQGQLIGLAGATGNAMGAHLHFEIFQSGLGQVNPWPRLP